MSAALVAPAAAQQGRVELLKDDRAAVAASVDLGAADYTLHFGFSRVDPPSASSTTLDAVASRLRDDASLRLRLEAHTDSMGWALGNVELSRLRARAVALELVRRGVHVARVEARAYGESHPIARNATAEGRRRNRRVELTLFEEP